MPKMMVKNFTGAEKVRVAYFDTMCACKGCKNPFISRGTEFVRTAGGRDGHLICAAKEAVRK